MKRESKFGLAISLVLLAAICSIGFCAQKTLGTIEIVQSDLLKKYAGTYTIKVTGDNSGVDEILELKVTGECIWSYNGQKKYGKWTAEAGIIKTVVRGNSGDIPEDFKYNGAKFVSTDSNTRYLKKRV